MKVRTYKHSKIEFIEAQLNHFTVTLCSLGASIFEIKSGSDYLTLTPENIDDFCRLNLYHGKTIGPVANRIKNSTIKIGKKLYEFEPNEGPNLLHSGIKGLSNQIFEVKYTVNNGVLLVKYRRFVRHLSDGFPGNRAFEITYQISEIDDLKIRLNFDVKSDKKTLLRLTNHCYFNLGEFEVEKLRLKFKASKYIFPDDFDLCPLSIKTVPNYLDFSNGNSLSKAVNNENLCLVKAKGLDHYLFFDDKPLTLDSLKYSLDIVTDFDGVQLYSDNYEDNISYRGTKKVSHRALAVEPSDSNLTNNPTNNYHRFIEYKIRRL